MDQTQNQNLQTMSVSDDQLKKSQYLRKTLQFLLPVISIFSFTLSYSSSFHFSINGYLSVFSFYLLNYTIDRKYMFLLCNGILVFLAKNFEFFSSTDIQDKLATRNVDQFWSKPEFSETDYVVEKEVVVESVNGSFENILENEDIGEEVREVHKDENEKEEENGIFFAHEDKKEEEKRVPVEGEGGGGGGEQVAQEKQEKEGKEEIEEQKEQEDEEEEEDGSLSTEELNKKFEEFIKKTKEEIRIGAQEQLVFV